MVLLRGVDTWSHLSYGPSWLESGPLFSFERRAPGPDRWTWWGFSCGGWLVSLADVFLLPN